MRRSLPERSFTPREFEIAPRARSRTGVKCPRSKPAPRRAVRLSALSTRLASSRSFAAPRDPTSMGRSGKIARMGNQAYEKQKKLQKHAERHGTAAAGSKIKGVHKPVRKPKPGETKRKNIKT